MNVEWLEVAGKWGLKQNSQSSNSINALFVSNYALHCILCVETRTLSPFFPLSASLLHTHTYKLPWDGALARSGRGIKGHVLP